MDGPIFLKSGVTLEGSYSDNYPTRSFFTLYEGDNNGKTAEEAIVVVDGVTDVTASAVFFYLFFSFCFATSRHRDHYMEPSSCERLCLIGIFQI